MDFVVGLLVLVGGLLISIGLHELGHLVPAKLFGVRVSQYMIGFGPTLWSREYGETEYGLKGIPLGGYCRLVGMYPPESALSSPPRSGWFSEVIGAAREASAEEIRPGEDHRAFYRLSTPKKLVVMAGGTFTNLLVAFVLIAIVFIGIGVPGNTQTTTVAGLVECVSATPTAACTDSDPVSPAVEAGLEPGDRIVSWGGAAVTSWDDLTAAIQEGPGSAVPVVVERDGEQLTLTVDPVVTDLLQWDADGELVTDANGDPVFEPGRYIGFIPTTAIERLSAGAALSATGDAVSQTVNIVANLPDRLEDATRAALGLEQRDQTSVIGLVGVARLAVQVGTIDDTTSRVSGWLMLLASLNVALFVFNLIPLVPMDGGHVAAALWEGARRQYARMRGRPRPAPLDAARMIPVAYAVFVLLVAMGVVLMVADIVAPVTI
jgi:membrane-associated protease RseP (regulator of RpoE activity)